MAKNMYKKRKEMKEAKVNNDESLYKTSINWDISTDVKSLTNLYKKRTFEK